MEKRINTAWRFVFDKLVHPNTNQIYDYRSSEDVDGTFRHLPTSEEMAKCIPNPCGWFTGMEDSDINGGIMLDASIDRIEVTGDRSLVKYIDILYDGLMLNTKVSEQNGFLARAVHPADRKSHYMNSSRDQYTHWIFGMTHYYDSELCTYERREEIRKALVSFAEKAERDVTEEHDMSLVREDGMPAIVCRMKGEKLCWHETNRLPMFYLAAYHVSGDEHWLDMYKKERDWGLDKAEKIEFDMNFFKGVFALMQMQLSLRLLWNYETDESYRKRYKALMERVAEATEEYLPIAYEHLKSYPNEATVIPWREVPEDLRETTRMTYGYPVNMHYVYCARGTDYHTYLRNASEGLIAQNLCPGWMIKREQEETFYEVIGHLNFERAYNYYPVAFCGAYWALQKNKQ